MAFEQTLKKDWYSILGADPSAHVSDLKQKYQKLILLYHPDKQSADAPAGTMEECMQKFIEIDQAWKILGNEETKKCMTCSGMDEYLKMEDKEINLEPMRNESLSSTDIHVFKSLNQAELRSMGPVDTQVYLEEMSWNKDDGSFSLTCRCGGKYTVSKDEVEEVNLISCDTCSLIVELLHQH